MPPSNPECFRGKRAGVAGLQTSNIEYPTSNIETSNIEHRMLSHFIGHLPSGGVPNANYFGDDRGPGERRLHPADSIAAWMS
jgi:hypothetical protein